MRTVREGLGVTQVEIAQALATDQAEISRMERRPDLMLSTCRKYAAALGAKCELAFVFEDGSRVLIAEPVDEATK